MSSNALKRLGQFSLALLALCTLGFDACVLISAPLLDGAWPKSAISVAITLQVVTWGLLWQRLHNSEGSLLTQANSVARGMPVLVTCAIFLMASGLILPSAFRISQGNAVNTPLSHALTRTCLNGCEALRRVGHWLQTGQRQELVLPP